MFTNLAGATGSSDLGIGLLRKAVCLGASQSIPEHPGTSWSVPECLGVSWSILEHPGASCSILEHPGAS